MLVIFGCKVHVKNINKKQEKGDEINTIVGCFSSSYPEEEKIAELMTATVGQYTKRKEMITCRRL
jgi:hypothetical protein